MFNLIIVEEGNSPVEAFFDGENLKTNIKIDREFTNRVKSNFEGITTRGISVFRLPKTVSVLGMNFVTEGLSYLRVEGVGHLYHEHGAYYFIREIFLMNLKGAEGFSVDHGYSRISSTEIENDKTGKISLNKEGLCIPTIILMHAMSKELLIKSIEVQDLNGVLLAELVDSNSYLVTDRAGLLYKVDMSLPPGNYAGGLEPKVLVEYYSVIMNMDEHLKRSLYLFLDNYYGTTQ